METSGGSEITETTEAFPETRSGKELSIFVIASLFAENRFPLFRALLNQPVTSAVAAMNFSMLPAVSPATLMRPDPAK